MPVGQRGRPLAVQPALGVPGGSPWPTEAGPKMRDGPQATAWPHRTGATVGRSRLRRPGSCRNGHHAGEPLVLQSAGIRFRLLRKKAQEGPHLAGAGGRRFRPRGDHRPRDKNRSPTPRHRSSCSLVSARVITPRAIRTASSAPPTLCGAVRRIRFRPRRRSSRCWCGRR